MSKLDLILKDITDIYVRENFFRLKKFFDPVPFLQGDFTFFEVPIAKATDKFVVRHGLSFIPEDAFLLSVVGNQNFYFRFNEFDETNIYIHAEGPCVIRFLLGRLPSPKNRPVKGAFPQVSPIAPVVTTITGAAAESPKLAETFNTDAGTLPGNLVKVTATNTVTKISDNLVTTIPNGVFGMAWTKPSATNVKVLFLGIMDGFTGFTPGLPLFVSPAGVPTHTAPSTGTVQQIGFAISPTQVFVQLGQPMRRS